MESPPKTETTVAETFVERVRAWWESGGKVCIASDDSLKRIRVPGRNGLAPQGSEYGLGVWVSTGRISGRRTERGDGRGGVDRELGQGD